MDTVRRAAQCPKPAGDWDVDEAAGWLRECRQSFIVGDRRDEAGVSRPVAASAPTGRRSVDGEREGRYALTMMKRRVL
jgi:hypothetical protein